jgi:hypothetical protein
MGPKYLISWMTMSQWDIVQLICATNRRAILNRSCHPLFIPGGYILRSPGVPEPALSPEYPVCYSSPPYPGLCFLQFSYGQLWSKSAQWNISEVLHWPLCSRITLLHPTGRWMVPVQRIHTACACATSLQSLFSNTWVQVTLTSFNSDLKTQEWRCWQCRHAKEKPKVLSSREQVKVAHLVMSELHKETKVLCWSC